MKPGKTFKRVIVCFLSMLLVIGGCVSLIPATTVKGAEDNLLDSSFYIDGNKTGAETIEVTTEKVHSGTDAIKFANRSVSGTTLERNCAQIEVGKTYVYTAWIYASAYVWVNAQAEVFATATNGAEMYGGVSGGGVLLKNDTWTTLTAIYSFYEENGDLYVKVDNGAPVKVSTVDANSTDTTFDVLDYVSFGFSSTSEAQTFYVDDVAVYELRGDLLKNGTFESGTLGDEFYIGGNKTGNETLAIATDNVHTGSNAVVYANRSLDGTTFLQNCDSIELGKTYTYSAWVYASADVWVNAQAEVIAKATGGSTMYGGASDEGVLLSAGTWTAISAIYSFYVENGDLYIKVDNAVPVKVAAVDASSNDTVFDAIDHIIFGFGSTLQAQTFYVDDVSVFDNSKNLFEYVIKNPDEGIEDEGTEDEGTEDEGTENEGTENEGTGNESTENEGTENESTESEDAKVTYEELLKNVGFEAGNFDSYSTQGDNIKVEVTTEDAHDGDYSAKVTDFQSANEMIFQSISGDEIKLNEWYHFSAWVKPSTTSWCALIVTPWATGKETGGMMWNDSYYSQVAEAGVWTKLECSYMFYIEDGKLYVTNGTESKLIQNHAGTGDVTFDSLVQVDFKVNTEDYVEVLYVDDMSLRVEPGSIPQKGDSFLPVVMVAIMLTGCGLVVVATKKRRA